jgi:putative ABC transport system substrate-binding protein
MMRLRKRLVSVFLAVASCVAFPQMGYAEQKGLPRIAIIFPQSPSFDQPLREQLTAKGFVEGNNIKIDWRSYKGWDATMESMVAEFVRSSPDVIVVHGTPATRAVLRQTKTIPVVFDVGDPLATGLLSSLSHPDRNATGVSTTSVEGSAKLFDLITQLVPDARRVLVVRNPLNPLAVQMGEHVRSVAASVQVHLSVLDANNADELVSALKKIDKHRADAILIPTDLVFRTGKERIIRAVLNTGLPAVYQDLSLTEAGGLVAYGPDGIEIAQIVASLVEKILRGAKPAELPVEQVTKLKLVVNLRTAKAMGITIPQSILLRADEVIR